MGTNVWNGIQLFPPDCILNRRCDDLPVHPQSANWITQLQSQFTGLSVNWNGAGGAIPTLVNDLTDSFAPVIPGQYANLSDAGGYYIPLTAPIDTSGDLRVITVHKQRRILSEITPASINNGIWNCNSGGNWNLANYDNHFPGFVGGNAAGLPCLALFPRYEELYVNGAIQHAIGIDANTSLLGYLWPATAASSYQSKPQSWPPLGARLRLNAAFNIPAFTSNAAVQVLLTAMQRYGMIIRDDTSGTTIAIPSTQDSRWVDTPFYGGTLAFPAFTSTNYEFVDESMLMLSPTSFRSVT